jgi:Tfp pilus assembly protein PilZ
MERREQARRSRRVPVQFWKQGGDKRYRGYSANISTGGMYIDTNTLFGAGSRIRLEIGTGEHAFMAEAVVARVNKSHQTLRTSGMGVRFLTIDELVGELLPEISSNAPAHVGPGEAPLPAGSYRMRFTDRQQLKEVYARDLATGGLFIPTDQPAALNAVVTVEVSVADASAAPVRLEARVVHRLDPGMPDGTSGNLMAGIGVEILNLERALQALRALAGPFE